MLAHRSTAPCAFCVAATLITTFFWLSGCGSKPILPDAKKIEVSREAPGKKCKEIGPVYGKSIAAIKNEVDAEKEALEDLKENSAKKGANFVHLEQYSAYGSSVKGTAYDCD